MIWKVQAGEPAETRNDDSERTMDEQVTFTKALADPTRQKIMQILCCRWLNVSEVVAQLNVTQPTVSHHLSVLRAAGLVDVRREGKQIFYTLNQEQVAANCCQLVESFAPDQTAFTIRGSDEQAS